jgi:hypothetical protein
MGLESLVMNGYYFWRERGDLRWRRRQPLSPEDDGWDEKNGWCVFGDVKDSKCMG